MVYKKIQSEEGNYIDKNGLHYNVLEADEAWTPQGLNAGWDEYNNIEAALQSYGLVQEEQYERRMA